MIIYIKVSEECTRNVFLISVNSFPEFFKIIKNSKVLDNFGNTSLEENLEKDLKNYSKNYQQEEIKFYCSYQECKELALQNNENENEFIIVDDSFLENINYHDNKINHKKVKMYINALNSIMKIKFPISQNEIDFEEKEKGFYKFKIAKIDKFNPYIPVIENPYNINMQRNNL